MRAQKEATPSSRLFRTCPREPLGRLPVTRVPAPPCPASGRRPTPGRPGPNGKRPPSPPRRPGTAGHRNASTGAGEALQTGEAATAWPTPRQAKHGDLRQPQKKQEQRGTPKAAGSRASRTCPRTAGPRRARRTRQPQPLPPLPRYYNNRLEAAPPRRAGGPAASLRRRVRLCPLPALPTTPARWAGTEAGPPPARRGIRLAGSGHTSRGARVERRAVANRSAGRWLRCRRGSAAGNERGLVLGLAGAVRAGREDEPVPERAAQLAGDGVGHRRREYPAELPRSRLSLREAVHRQPRPR